MDRFVNLFLAQSAINNVQDLKTVIWHALSIVVILGYIYGVIFIIMACVQERGDGSK